MKTLKKINAKLIIVIVLIIVAGHAYSQIKGNGNIKTQERNTEDFTGIKLTCSADLFISQGSTSVIVKTDENLLELVETTVNNGVLEIDVKGRGIRSISVLEVYITLPELVMLKNSGSGDITFKEIFNANDLVIGISGSGDLDADLDVSNLELNVNGSGDTELNGVKGNFKVSLSGSGDIEAEGLKLENCLVKNSGSGDIELKGKTNNLMVSQAGSGDLNAYNLTSVNASVTNSGSADIILNVVEKLQVTLNGSGDLTYHGTPTKVDVRSNGSGEVYRR
ncbi:MAG: DUF2807 domain-containing protein [Bacteroidetes bacterium]|nr:DUF2807 domain-containing protein [Bacteroidota bacterium]MBL6942957.1 DUF2807 domain-containing protein [Bacteroidales bacterium]